MGFPRITTQWLMGAALATSLGLGLGLPAAEVYQGRRGHVHTFINVVADEAWLDHEEFIKTPFWQSYWLRLNGKPWRRQPICGTGRGRVEETCEIADLNILFRACFSSYKRPVPTESMKRRFPNLK